MDFAGPINDTYYLLAVDALSKWPEVVPTKRITTAATISILRKIFGRLGMPEVLVSDNGAQLTSDSFERFCGQQPSILRATVRWNDQENSGRRGGAR